MVSGERTEYSYKNGKVAAFDQTRGSSANLNGHYAYTYDKCGNRQSAKSTNSNSTPA